MCKKFLRPDQTGAAMSTVADAAMMARAMVAREARGSGDRANALRRLARRYGIPHGTLWALLYRPPHDLWAGVFLKLQAAYRAELTRQAEALAHEITLARAAGADGDDLARALGTLAAARDLSAADAPATHGVLRG